MASSRLALRRCFLHSSRALHKNSILHKENVVDPKEVEHFTNFDEEWLNPNGQLKALFAMNDLRVPFVRNGLVNTKKISEETARSPKCLKGIKILDVGCGGGIFSVPLARLGAEVTGLDPASKVVDIARLNAEKLCLTENLRFESGTIQEFSTTHGEQYDAVVCSEVIEHVPAKESFVNSCVAVTKPGGSLFFTTISQTTTAWLLAIVVAERLNLMPPGTHEYDKLITSKDLSCYFEKADCNVLTINGMMYNPLANTWTWCPSDIINYALHAIKRYK